MIHAALPMDHLAIDLFTCNMTPDGFNYALLIIDIATRFAWLHPLKSKRAEEVGDQLFKLCCDFGIPAIIQSDNGKEFDNAVVAHLSAKLGFEHRKITAYNAKANGAAERLVRTIKTKLFAEVKGNVPEWPNRLKAVQFWYNQTVHRRHGSTPFSLMFARAPVPPSALSWTSTKKPVTLEELGDLAEHMARVVWPAVAERSQHYSKRAYEQFIKSHRIVHEEFPPGALVMRKVVLKGSNMEPKFEGPYTVVRRNAGGAYLLRDRTGDIVAQRAPADQLRLVSLEGNISAESFVIEKLLDHQVNPDGSYSYLIKWSGYPLDDATWENEAQFDTQEVIVKYWATKAPNTRLAQAGKRRAIDAEVPTRAKKSRRIVFGGSSS